MKKSKFRCLDCIVSPPAVAETVDRGVAGQLQRLEKCTKN